MSSDLQIVPVTSDRWDDLATLSGDRGAFSGCWCMWFRVAPKTWQSNGNEGNRAAMKQIVSDDRVPGLLALSGGRPVGWISVAPRREFERIAGPAGTDEDAPIWSVVCFYIEPGQRGGGTARALLDAAIEHARANGAKVLESYPIEPHGRADNAAAFTGTRPLFEDAGFRQAGRFDRWRAVPDASGPTPKKLVRPPGRPVMRLEL